MLKGLFVLDKKPIKRFNTHTYLDSEALSALLPPHSSRRPEGARDRSRMAPRQRGLKRGNTAESDIGGPSESRVLDPGDARLSGRCLAKTNSDMRMHGSE